MDLTPRQRADIVHVALAAAADLGIKVNAIASDYSGARISLHLHRETNAYKQGRTLFDGMNPTEVNGGSHFPGSPACPPYSTIEGRASICGVDVEVCIFTDYANPEADPEPESAEAVTECDPDPECTGCGSQHCAGCDAVPAGQPAQCWPAEATR